MIGSPPSSWLCVAFALCQFRLNMSISKSARAMETKSNSLHVYFGLVFLLCIPLWILGGVYSFELLPGLPVSAVIAFTPALAALILTYKMAGLLGTSKLLKRSFDLERVKAKRYFLIIVLFNPAVAVMAYLILTERDPTIPAVEPIKMASQILPLFALFFVGSLGEELGWTGYATKPLIDRWGILGAGLFLGVVWSVFHAIPLLQVERSFDWIAWWTLGTISLRILMIWLYATAGPSVFAATIFHTTINLSWQLFPVNGSHYDPRIFGLILFSAAFLISIFNRMHNHAKIDP